MKKLSLKFEGLHIDTIIMLSNKTLEFLKDLKTNNNREWFAINKLRYDDARTDVEKLTGELLDAINKFDPEVGHPEPKKCMFRIYRDTRFSANKEPYKVNMGAILRSEENKRGFDHADYYVHIEQGNCFISCGVYMPSPAVLKALRTAIYEDYDTFFEMVQQADFKEAFGRLFRDEETLKRVPSGFDKEHPASEYLKLKHFYVFYPVKDNLICSNKFVEEAARIFELSKPLKNWLNKVIDDVV